MRARLMWLSAIMILIAATTAAQTPSTTPEPPNDWAPLAFLLGEWDGIGTGAPGPDRAVYFDNEGHVINYTLEAPFAPGQATFVSDAVAGRPRFRLTYRLNDSGTLTIAFAIAPPGAAEFKTYLEGTARRR